MISTPDPKKHLLGYGRQDTVTGMLHGHIRWPDGSAPTPFGCRWCGTEQGGHGRRWIPGRGQHSWEQPTRAQILARMKARRDARKAVCRCDEPGADPYSCEADDCGGHFSELNPFGGSRPVDVPSAEVSRTCGCGWRTTVWHVDDGSAEEELHGHIVRVHGGSAPAPETGGA